MRNGWYESTRGTIHYIEDGHYVCNSVVRPTPIKKWKKVTPRQMTVICKSCARKGKRNE